MSDLILISPGATVYSGGEVLVAILPVGDVPRHVLDAYMACINQSRHIALSNMRVHYHEPTQKTPFGNLDWDKGFMHFRFLRQDEARKKSRTSDLHRQRQIVAVLGVVHCPWTPSLRAACVEFTKMCSLLFPEAPIQRCLLANPSEDHLRQSKEDIYDNFILFQPGGSIKHLEQQFSLWLHDLAALVLAVLEHWVLSASPLGMPMGPACYADSPEFTCSTLAQEDATRRFAPDEDEAHEKKRWGRLMKAKGDLCLMAGSCQDAFDHYRTCSDLARVSNDLVWYGGAVEGMASALALQALASATPCPFLPEQAGLVQLGIMEPWMVEPSSAGMCAYTHPAIAEVLQSTGVEGEIRALLLDARATYKRKGGVPAASIEVALKLARLAASLRGGGGKQAQQEVTDMVATVLEAVPGLVASVEDRMVALEEAAMVLRTVGPTRKRSLLLWYACELATRVSGPRGGGGLAVRIETLRLASQALVPPHRLRGSTSSALGLPSSAIPAALQSDEGSTAASHTEGAGAAPGLVDNIGLGANGGLQQQESGEDIVKQARERLPHWAQKGAWHEGTPPWGYYSWSCLPPSVRMHYLATVAPTLLGGVTAARQSVPDTGQASCQPSSSASSSTRLRHFQPGSADSNATRPGPEGRASEVPNDTQQQPASMDGQTDSGQLSSTSHFGPAPAPLSSPTNAPAKNSRPPSQQSLPQPSSPEEWKLPEGHAASLACGPPMWGGLRMGLLEVALNAAQQTNAAADVWEVCAALLRDHCSSLSGAQHISLLEAASQAAASLSSGSVLTHALVSGQEDAAQAWQDEGRARCGPGPIAVLNRIIPAPLGLQPLCFSIAAITGMGNSSSSSNGSPFIFNPASVTKAEGQAVAAAAATARMWCAGEDGGVEVWLWNPLAVPLKLESLSLHARLLPDSPAWPQPVLSTNNSSTSVTTGHNKDQDESSQHQNDTTNEPAPSVQPSRPASSLGQTPSKTWEAHAIGPVMLPQGGVPIRCLLQGKSAVAGRLQLLGVHASMWGVTWLQPFTQPPVSSPLQATLRSTNTGKSSPSSTSGTGNTVMIAATSNNGNEGDLEPLTVVPELPVLHGVFHGPQGLKILTPPDGGLQTAAAATSGTTRGPSRTPRSKGPPAPPVPKATVVDVWEGQTMQCQLELKNASRAPSSLSVASARSMVMNAKGGIMKALPHTRSAHASLTGVTLDVDDGTLQAAMPLPAGASVSLPVCVRVGRVPPGGARDHVVAIEVSVLYTSSPAQQPQPQQQEQQQQQQLAHLVPPGHVMGHRLVLPLSFLVHSALQITTAAFVQQYTPVRDGMRCRQLPLPPQAPFHLAQHHPTDLPDHDSKPTPSHSHQALHPPISAPTLAPTGVISAQVQMLNTAAKLHPSNIAHHLQAALEPLASPGEKLRAALGIGQSGAKHKQQAPLSAPGSAQGRSTQRSATHPHQSGPHASMNGAANGHAHEKGNNGKGPCLEELSHQHQQQAHQERLEHAAQGLNTRALEGVDSVGGWHDVEGAAGVPATSGTEAQGGQRHVGDTMASLGAGSESQLSMAAQQGEVLMGLVCDSVLRVCVTNQSSGNSFRVWLAKDGGAARKGGDTPLDGDRGARISTSGLEVGEVGMSGLGASDGSYVPAGSSKASETETAAPAGSACNMGLQSCQRSPSVVLQPGESSHLLAYLSNHSHATPLQHVAAQSSAARPTSSSTLDLPPSSTRKWEPSGSNHDVAAAAIAATWVVMWQMVEGSGVRRGLQQLQQQQGAPVQGSGAEEEMPHGVAWLSAADLAKGMTPAAAAALHPPSLHFSLHAVSYPFHSCSEDFLDTQPYGGCASLGCGVHPHMHDVSGPLAKLGGLASHAGLGQLWAVGLGLGQLLEVRVGIAITAPSAETAAALASSSSVTQAVRGAAATGTAAGTAGGDQGQLFDVPPLHVCYNVCITRVAPTAVHTALPAEKEGASAQAHGCSGEGDKAPRQGSQTQHHGASMTSSSAGHSSSANGTAVLGSNCIDEGVLVVSGVTQEVHVGLLPSRTHWQPLLLSFTRPGMYQVCVSAVATAPLDLHIDTTRYILKSGSHLGERDSNGQGHHSASCYNGGFTSQPAQSPQEQGRLTDKDTDSCDGEAKEDWDAVDMALTAAVLRGRSLAGQGALARTPARADILNVLALAPSTA